MKTGFVAIVGRPNVGKSTLLNSILGEKIAIVTSKPQTTRNRIRGIYTEGDVQMVFIDTPGIHKPNNKLDAYMTGTAVGTLHDVDAVLFLMDGPPSEAGGDRYIIDLLKGVGVPKLALINKIDIMSPDVFKAAFDACEATGVFQKTLGVSAKDGTRVPEVLEALGGMLGEGRFYYPADMVTDHPERFIVSEIIREKLLLYLEAEVPHGVAVGIESFEEGERLVKIGAVVYCEKKSHKGIIIGKDGKKLKGVGKSARLEIEGLLGTKVFLEIWVKVKEKWRDNEALLGAFGYKD
ncbi:MAG: GTPase Era [Clostridiales Family XIII bacterium]|jgi:GTP-binding protein Era|nr:GTPase Era [Clostridiales Family XIII bacterium]